MSNLDDYQSDASASSIDYEKQLRLDEKLNERDMKRHQGFFASLSEKGKVQKAFASLVVVAALVSTGFIAYQDQRNQQIEDSSAYDCNEFQVKVYDTDSYTCKDCPFGEFGKLSLCQKESPTGICEQTGSGCFVPDL